MTRAARLALVLASTFALGACARGNPPQLPRELPDRVASRGVRTVPIAAPPMARPAPGAAAPSEARFVVPTVMKLATGVTAVLVPRHDFPTVTAQLVLDRGLCSGGAAAVVHASSLGADPEDSSAVNYQHLRELAVRFESRATGDATVVGVDVLAPLARAAILTVGPFFMRPRPAPADISLVRRLVVEAPAEGTEFSAKLERAGMHILFGGAGYGAAFAHPSRAELDQVTEGALAAYRASALSPAHTTVIVVGDFDPRSMIGTLQAATAKGDMSPDWRPPTCIGDARAEALPSTVKVLDHAGTTQVRLAVFARGVPAGHADEAPLDVLASALGRSLSSRLSLHVRERRGWTYGITMDTNAMRHAGLVAIRANVQRERAVEALDAIVAELTEAATSSPTGEELARARSLAAVVPHTHSEIALSLSNAASKGLPFDYPEKRHRATVAVTSEDVARVAREYLSRDKLVIVLEGDREALEPRLRAARYDVADVRE